MHRDLLLRSADAAQNYELNLGLVARLRKNRDRSDIKKNDNGADVFLARLTVAFWRSFGEASMPRPRWRPPMPRQLP